MTKSSLTAGQMSGNKEKKEVQIITTLSASIAHELRNYMGTINLCAELSEIQLIKIKKAVKSADFLLSNLMSQIKGIAAGTTGTKDFKLYPIAKNISEALEQYLFQENERESVNLELSNDFEYLGNPALTTQIIHNLLRNALRAVKNAGQGAITIRLEPAAAGAKFNKLIFSDTATAISKEFLPKMFALFESQMTGQGGTGVGLAFCKTIMQSYGGDISCDSVEGEYTEFVLSFPTVDDNDFGGKL